MVRFPAQREVLILNERQVLDMSERRMMVMLASLERNLVKERRIITEAILGQGGLKVGLSYPALPANYLHKLNLTCLDDSDYVVILLGNEYGSLTPQGVSYVHAIYATAQASRKRVISLIYTGSSMVRSDPFDQKRLQGLKDLLKTTSVYFWKNSEELRDCAERALEDMFESYPSTGWVKSNSQTSTEQQQLIDQLNHQVTHLKMQLTQKDNDRQLDFTLNDTPWSVSYTCNAFREGRLKQIQDNLSLDMSQVFQWIAVPLLTPMTEAKLKATLSNHLVAQALSGAKKNWIGCHAVSDIKISSSSFNDLKLKLRKQNLIRFDINGRWMLTSMGEQIVLSGSTF